MIPAYEGKEPYIFVSYAHKDSAAVFHIVEQLNARGYRIWYDEGIEPGSEWPEYIANHLLGAEMVLSVLTPNAVNSVNCRREINFALSKNKPVLTIYMEDIELPVAPCRPRAAALLPAERPLLHLRLRRALPRQNRDLPAPAPLQAGRGRKRPG